MAQLPPDGTLLMQQNDGVVTIFDRYTQEEYERYDASDADATCHAVKRIWDSDRLNDEQKCFACFWAGYFHSYN